MWRRRQRRARWRQRRVRRQRRQQLRRTTTDLQLGARVRRVPNRFGLSRDRSALHRRTMSRVRIELGLRRRSAGVLGGLPMSRRMQDERGLPNGPTTRKPEPSHLRHGQRRVRAMSLEHGLHRRPGQAHLRHDDRSLRRVQQQQRLRRDGAEMLPRRSRVRPVPRELRLRKREARLRSARLHVSRGLHRRIAMRRRDAHLQHQREHVRRVPRQQRLQSPDGDLRQRRSVRRVRDRHRLQHRDATNAVLRSARRQRAMRAMRPLEPVPAERAELQQQRLRSLTASRLHFTTKLFATNGARTWISLTPSTAGIGSNGSAFLMASAQLRSNSSMPLARFGGHATLAEPSR